MNSIKDKIRGSLFAGAVGDALGYAVEFDFEEVIFSRYGRNGIQEYETNRKNKNAVISDDTQMSLFTASAIICEAEQSEGNISVEKLRHFALLAYQDWLITQQNTFNQAEGISFSFDYLRDIPELFKCRAPGNTCLSALQTRQQMNNSQTQSFISSVVNRSKGCGGVMRVSPIGMFRWNEDIRKIDLESAECAAITHCHPLGYMTAAVLTHIVYRLIYGEEQMTLKEVIIEARDTVAEIFNGFDYVNELINCIDYAIALSENKDTDLENIHRLGQGWVAEETLAIAIYCSLKYQTDFSRAITTSVNHNGDSDSTGAVTGNILGALIGYKNIDIKWKENLELSETILNIADMLYKLSN